MSLRRMDLSRRRLLRGAAGATLGLPWLEIFGRGARAAEARVPVCAAFVVNMNGVQQAGFGNEPERFWPKTLGPLTGLAAETDRATSELAAHAERLLMIRGLRLPFPGSGCSHSAGGNQLLSAAKVSTNPAKNKSLAMGASVDNHIARRLGVEPLTLYAGPKGGYINDHISFTAALTPRVGENNPWRAYTRLIGLQENADAAQRIARRRLSVNDLVREEMKEVLARDDLSMGDRKRLTTHFEAVREIETTITTRLSLADEMRLRAVDGKHADGTIRLEIERMQMDLMALAMAGGTRVCFLQIGDGTDGVIHVVDGVKLPRFHLISHRASSDGAVGDGTMPDAVNQHHDIDRIVMRQWKYFLDRLAMHQTPAGNLLDVGFAVWSNHVATGNHNVHNIPFLIAGRAQGYWRTGQYWSATGNTNPGPNGTIPHNKLLNSFINAFGVTKTDGAPVDDFGDPSLPRGYLSAVVRT